MTIYQFVVDFSPQLVVLLVVPPWWWKTGQFRNPLQPWWPEATSSDFCVCTFVLFVLVLFFICICVNVQNCFETFYNPGVCHI